MSTLHDALQEAIDRAEPPGVWKAGNESISVAVLRGLLRDYPVGDLYHEGYEEAMGEARAAEHEPNRNEYDTPPANV